MNKALCKAMQLLPDSAYIKLKYYHHFHRFPDLKHPKSYNEKLQWLKLHDRNPLYITLVDKFEAKKYISDIVGEQYVIPTYGVWDRFDEIDFNALPDKFVLKTTHDCGGVVICKDKAKFNTSKAKAFLEHHQKFNYFYEGREWAYKNVKPRIIAEQYLENQDSADIMDYKIFVFGGEAKALFVASDRQNKNEETKFDFYDMDFRHLDIRNGHPNSTRIIERPINLKKMQMLAEKLAGDLPQIRVDFYEVQGQVYVGELTFFHFSGFVPFEPEKWDEIFGSWINLPDR